MRLFHPTLGRNDVPIGRPWDTPRNCADNRHGPIASHAHTGFAQGAGNRRARVVDLMDSKMVDREPPALKALRAAARFCDQTIGWNRIGFVLSVTIIAIAAVALYRILHDIEIDEVIQAFLDSDPIDVAAAALFVGCGYFTLTFYDLFALRTIGRPDVPYRVAALAGFTSYSVGPNVGASGLTGGAVRYRIYSAWGLDAIAVAKICFVAGLTFWLGNATVLGLGISFAPQAATAIDQLPAWVNRLAAILTLIVLA